MIPFEDDHIMTREEAMIVLSKIVGINDYAMSLHMTVKKFDYEPFEDIDYNSYKGRLLDLAINIYGENSYPTRKLFYFNNTNFYGEDHVSGLMFYHGCLIYYILKIISIQVKKTLKNGQ